MNKDLEESYLAISVRSLYEMQKLRIQAGNRIVAAFRHKLGIMPSQSEEQSEEEVQKLLGQLRAEYHRITDGVTRITKKFKSDSALITNNSEILLLKSYDEQLNAEETHKKLISIELENYPIYTRYLKHINGIGPLMASVIITSFDIHKANKPSSFHAYAGIDAVYWFELKERHSPDAPNIVRRRHPEGYKTEGPSFIQDQNSTFSLFDLNGNLLGKYGLPPVDAEGFRKGRSTKKCHLVEKTYVNRKGEVTNTVGLTYDPILRSKLLGVLTTMFAFRGGYYKDVMTAYKLNVASKPEHATKTKAHIHNMAKRYVIKEFLSDLWTAWRILEKLPVRPTYEEEKLGKKRFIPYSEHGKPEIMDEHFDY